MPRFRNVNGERVAFSEAEETARDLEEQAWASGEETRIRDAIVEQIDAELKKRLRAGIIWKFEEAGDPHMVSLGPSMEKFLMLISGLLQGGAKDPHKGYLRTMAGTITGPDGSALSDEAIGKLCVFAGMWGLEMSRIAIVEEINAYAMDIATMRAYNAEEIDWTVDWGEEYPEWSDNITTHKP